MIKFKKFLALVLMVSLFLGAIRSANAFVPPPALAITGVSSTGALVALGASGVAAVAAVALGAVFLYYIVTKPDGSQVRIPSGTASNNIPPAPVVTSPAPSPIAGATAPAGYTLTNSGCRSYDGGASYGFCDGSIPLCMTNFGNQGGNALCVDVYSKSGSPIVKIGYSIASSPTFASGVQNGNSSCPSGYTYSSGSCTLTAPRQAVSDNSFDYGRAGTTFSNVDSSDIDQSFKMAVSTTSATNDTVTVGGLDSLGRPQQFKVQNTTTGTKIQIQTQKVDAANNTYTETQTFTTDLTGQITEVKQTADNTSLVLNPSSTTTASTYTPTATSSTISANPAAQPQMQSITFPSDYARTGESATAANTIKTAVDAQSAKLDTLHHDLTDTVAAPADLAVPDSTQFSDNFFKDTFTDLKGWTLPAHTATCPTANFDLTPYFGPRWNLSLNYQCTLAENQRSVLSVAMVVLWTLAAFFILMGA